MFVFGDFEGFGDFGGIEEEDGKSFLRVLVTVLAPLSVLQRLTQL